MREGLWKELCCGGCENRLRFSGWELGGNQMALRLSGLRCAWIFGWAAFVFMLAGFSPLEAASLRVVIDISDQTMTVRVKDGRRWSWPVSTARPGYRTPIGTFHPIRFERKWYSIKYDLAPMPWSIFFLGGYAIHGTTEISRLGRPVSHGCVRLHPDNARLLFSLASARRRDDTEIVVQP